MGGKIKMDKRYLKGMLLCLAVGNVVVGLLAIPAFMILVKHLGLDTALKLYALTMVESTVIGVLQCGRKYE